MLSAQKQTRGQKEKLNDDKIKKTLSYSRHYSTLRALVYLGPLLNSSGKFKLWPIL